MTVLTKKQKDEWVAALRSGDYKQCRDTLYSPWKASESDPDDVEVPPEAKSFCCLGVLKAAGIIDEEVSPYNVNFDKKRNSPDYRVSPAVLIRFNDDLEATFEEIADFIDGKISESALDTLLRERLGDI